MLPSYGQLAECETAFIDLKHLLTTAPVLAYPRFSPDVLEIDASGIGLGTILSRSKMME